MTVREWLKLREQASGRLRFSWNGEPIAEVTDDGQLGQIQTILSPDGALAYAEWVREVFA